MNSGRIWLLLLLALTLAAAPACGGGNDRSATDDEDDTTTDGDVDDGANIESASTNRSANRTPQPEPDPEPEPEPEPEGPPPGAVAVAFTPLEIPTGASLERMLYQTRGFDLATAMLLLMEQYDPQYNVGDGVELINRLARELADDLGEHTMLPDLKEKLSFRLFTKNRLRFRSDDSEESRTDVALLDLQAVMDNEEGNCVSLSALVLCVADRLGLTDVVRAASVPRHSFVVIGPPPDDRNGDLIVLETSQPDDPFTMDVEAKEHDLDYPPPPGSPFLRPLDRREFFSTVLNNFGLVLDAAGRQEEAVRWLEQAITLWRQNPHAQTNVGSIYLQQAVTLPDDSSQRRQLLVNAVKRANGALRGHESNREAYKILAVAYRLQDRIDDALDALDRAAPYFEDGSYELGRLRYLALIRGERGEDALKVLQEIGPAVPNDSDKRCEFEQAYALALILTDEPGTASDHLRRALELATADRLQTIMGAVMQAAAGREMWADGARWYDMLARRAERHDELVDFTVETGLAFGTHAVDVPRGEDPTDEQIDAAVDVLTRVTDVRDSAEVRREIFVILWNNDRSDAAVPHGLRAAELYREDDQADEGMQLLMAMALRFANAREAGAENLRKVVEGIKQQPEEYALEALFFEGMLLVAKQPQTEASLKEALEKFEAYIDAGGTNESAKNFADQIRGVLGD